MTDEILPYIPVVVIKNGYDSTSNSIMLGSAGSRPYLAQVITNPKLRADGETRDDALNRLRNVLRSYFLCTEEFEIVNMDINEILVEEVMGV
jgi:hypothetical protein